MKYGDLRVWQDAMSLVTDAYVNHLSIAFGSLMELETQVQIAARLEYITEDDANRFLAKTDQVGKMIGALKKSLSKS